MAMQTQASLKQLEFSMWQDLKTASSEPLAANLQQLWSKLEQVIELTDKSQKLRVLGDVIVAIVEIYVMRANAILSTLEASDSSGGEPILSEDFLNDLMRQSMSIDLSDMMEKLFPEPEPKPRSPVSARGNIVAPQDLSTDYAMPRAGTEQTFASIAPDDPKQMLVELAGNEQVSQWSAAISDWMQQRACGEIVSLLELQQALEMPLVDIWLGLLLSSGHQYDWERSGDFYSDAGEIWLKQR
jgi:hypothetical protein